VDIGGTFTDLAAYVPEAGRVIYAKSPTTYGDFTLGVINCLQQARVEAGAATLFKHGTTLVINTLLERTGARMALVTTRGFRDILEIGRGSRPEAFNLAYRRDEPLVPRPMRVEATERADGQGRELTPLTQAELERVATALREMGVEAVAISFLNSYRNPEHEATAQEYLSRALPGVFVSRGTELSREWHEYERSTTAAANAYVGPRVKQYIQKLNGTLHDQGFRGKFLLAGSNGGVLSAEAATALPLYLVESGPVGGCIGAAELGHALGISKIIAFDMGGTTAKCALVEEGQFGVNDRYYVGGYERGFPIQAPVIDIVEVGAGGGSIAWLDAQNVLHVGPRSAGSNPGPVAYGWGGTEPTVTDANVVLGRLNPNHVLGGDLVLDREAACKAIRERIAEPLGYPGEEGMYHMAAGILSITSIIMAGAIKRITVERGRDPRDYTLFAYGGAGPLHAVELARELSIPRVVIPHEPGNFSALGMLLADVRRDDTATFVGALDEEAMSTMLDSFAALEREAAGHVSAEFGDIPVLFDRFVEMRYKGQEHSVLTPVSDVSNASALRAAFEAAYRQRYGHSDDLSAVETVSLRVVTLGTIQKPEVYGSHDPSPSRAGTQSPNVSHRQVMLPGENRLADVAVYERGELETGFRGRGPAILDEYGSTVFIGRGDTFTVGRLGELHINVHLGNAPGRALQSASVAGGVR
jgi:N-methylhydantoinase A